MRTGSNRVMAAIIMSSMCLSATPVWAKNTKAYDHAIECSSAVAVVAALTEGNAETADISVQMKGATPKWLDIGRAMKLKSDDAVMEDHKAAVMKRLEDVLSDKSANNEVSTDLVSTAVNCLDEIS